MQVFTDSINTEVILGQKIHRNSTRWLDLRYFFVGDAAAKRRITLHRVDVRDNAANGFTKALGIEVFPKFLTQLGIDKS